MWRLTGWSIAVVFVILCCFIPTGYCRSALQRPNILLLNSYAREMQWTDSQVQGIITAYKDAGVQPAFFVEYLDWKYSPTNETLALLCQLFRAKYAQRPIDIIMTTDDAALEFALRHRAELFSNAPIVFSGVYPDTALRLTNGQRRVTGVQEVLDAAGTINLIQQLKPQTEHVYLIFDSTESGLAAEKYLLQALQKANPTLTCSLLTQATQQEIINTLRFALDNSAALMGSYSRDRDGVVKELERYVQIFCEHSRVPVYTLYDFALGHGVVGGSVISGQLSGRQAAELGLRILAGEDPDSIPPVNFASHAVILDYQQMMRYQLPLNAIPAGSQVINRPQTVYEQYKHLIWGTWLIFSFMTISIIVLALNIKQRKAAEASLKLANEELTATYEEVLASQEALQLQYEKLQAIQAQMHYMAYHDQLTGLYNRTALNEMLPELLRRSTSGKSVVLFIDIDDFKLVNDTYGHLLGDHLLVALAKKIAQEVGNKGFIARLGGDEFVIALTNCDERFAADFAQKIKELLLTPVQIGDSTVYVTFSMGLAMYPTDGATPEELLKNADIAMYRAKEQGKNRCVFYNGFTSVCPDDA